MLPDAAKMGTSWIQFVIWMSLNASEMFTDAPHAIRISPNATRMFHRNHLDAIRMFSNLSPTFAHCKSWGVGAPQGLGLGSAQIRVRVGLGPAARPACPSARPSVLPSLRPVRPSVRPPVPPTRPPARPSAHPFAPAALPLRFDSFHTVVCDIRISLGFLSSFSFL